jgi:hypothetical protein
MMQQIRIAMANREIEEIFEAVIEVDETYIGGKPKKTNAVLGVMRHFRKNLCKLLDNNIIK